MRVLNAPDRRAAMRAMLEFGRFFAGSLYDVYGGVLTRRGDFGPATEPRRRRPLDAPVPEIHRVTAADGVGIRLTRFPGGGRGPVLLSHGLGVSSSIFTLDTIETNLVEYLCAHGFDVWLLDYRASIDLPTARARSTADDVARFDYPAAIACVRSATAARDVQVVAHCYGSMTLLMALLAGLEGVRSALCSQTTLHLRPPRASRVKAGIFLPSILRSLGVGSLSAYAERHANWRARLFDRALRLQPTDPAERCHSEVCRRIVFLYSQVFAHERLNRATHEHLNELFGVANIAALEHLTRIVRRGQVVDAEGRDVYLPQLERLALPITFLQGADNGCFRPHGSEQTLALLTERHGSTLFRRELVPGYGHLDCIIGKDAARDVYPLILRHLERTEVRSGRAGDAKRPAHGPDVAVHRSEIG
jgi:cholesterol oxidase